MSGMRFHQVDLIGIGCLRLTNCVVKEIVLFTSIPNELSPLRIDG